MLISVIILCYNDVACGGKRIDVSTTERLQSEAAILGNFCAVKGKKGLSACRAPRYCQT
jgi:hypothetical protein